LLRFGDHELDVGQRVAQRVEGLGGYGRRTRGDDLGGDQRHGVAQISYLILHQRGPLAEQVLSALKPVEVVAQFPDARLRARGLVGEQVRLLLAGRDGGLVLLDDPAVALFELLDPPATRLRAATTSKDARCTTSSSCAWTRATAAKRSSNSFIAASRPSAIPDTTNTRRIAFPNGRAALDM
jgi:hypothetical protein